MSVDLMDWRTWCSRLMFFVAFAKGLYVSRVDVVRVLITYNGDAEDTTTTGCSPRDGIYRRFFMSRAQTRYDASESENRTLSGNDVTK